MNPFLVHLVLFTVAFIYGVSYTITKSIVPEPLPAFGAIFLRALAAGILFWISSLAIPSEPLKNKRDFWLLVVCGAFGVAINQLLFFKGLSLTSPANASLLMTITPILVLLISSYMLREKLKWLKIIGILLGFSGAVLLLIEKKFSFSSDAFLGDLCIFFNAVSYAIYLVLVKPLLKSYQAITVSKWVFLWGFLLIIPFGFSDFYGIDWSSLKSETYLSLGFIIVATTYLAYLLNAWSLRYVSPSMVGIYIYLQPLIATLMAVLFRGDSVELSLVLAACMIFSGVYLSTKN